MLSIDDRGPFPPCPSPFSLAEHVLWRNGADEDRIAMAVLGASRAERWSYGRLRSAVLATAAGLRAAGLSPGDRVALRLGNSPEFPVVFLAAIAAGILPAPVPEALTEAEAATLLAMLKPAAIIGRGGTLAPGVLSASTALPEIEKGDPDRPAYIVFTSGTSGAPRAVLHAHRSIWARRAMVAGWTDLRASDRVLHTGAFNWTYTLGTGLLDPWSVGATALVLQAGTGLELVPLLAQRHDATLIAGSPGVFRRLSRGPLPRMPKLRHALSAGEKLPETVRSRWTAATGAPVYEAFGQSECSTFISGAPGMNASADALGRIQPGRRVAIVDDGGPVPRNTEGEIAISADDPGVMLEYLDAPEATAARHRGGWFLTGDLGVMRDDGSIVHLGRGDDLLTAGGFRMSPIEIEDAMLGCEGIEDAAAVDHVLNEETRVVALHYASRDPLPEPKLAEHAARHLAAFKRPRIFVHHASLPRGTGGKLLRRRLRTATEESHD